MFSNLTPEGKRAQLHTKSQNTNEVTVTLPSWTQTRRARCASRVESGEDKRCKVTLWRNCVCCLCPPLILYLAIAHCCSRHAQILCQWVQTCLKMFGVWDGSKTVSCSASLNCSELTSIGDGQEQQFGACLAYLWLKSVSDWKIWAKIMQTELVICNEHQCSLLTWWVSLPPCRPWRDV